MSSWSDPKTWVRIFAGLSIATQAIYGILAYVYTLTQTTNIVSYYYGATYTGIQGAWLAGLLAVALIWFNTLAEFRARMWSFLSWFIFTYTVIVVWIWHYRHHNDTNSTPVPLTVPFMSYLCFTIFVTFASAFFIVIGWGVFTMRPEKPGSALSIESLTADYEPARKWFLGIGVVCFVFGILQGVWGWLFVTGYSFGPLGLQLGFFCGYSLFNIIQFIMFVYFNSKRASAIAPGTPADPAARDAGVLVDLFTRHWDELWATELFLAIVWIINFGAWVNIWRLHSSGVEWSEWPHFDADDMPVEYWNVFSNSVFNAIFAPLLVNYLATFWCYNNDIIEADLKQTTRLGTGGMFGWYFTGQTFRQRTSDPNIYKNVNIADVVGYTGKIALYVFFTSFLVYQLLAGGFIINELLQSTYLAEHYYVWYIFALVFLSVFFVVFVIYAITTYRRTPTVTDTDGRITVSAANSENVCTFSRPILTLLFVAFMTEFSYATIYSRYHTSDKEIPHTQVPDNEVNSQYYGILLTILGYVFTSVFFIAKDGMMTISNITFVYRPDAVTQVPLQEVTTATTETHHGRNGRWTSDKER